MKKTSIFLIIIMIALSLHISHADAESLHLNATAYILIDSHSGQVLYEQDADKKGVFPASTTKIMTAILALEKGAPDQVMTASFAAVHDLVWDEMNIGIMAGEEIRLENLLDALLISSANEAANIIAENLSPTREHFIELMTQRAHELGAVNTQYKNTFGRHHDEHYTTARDMAIIARHAMTFPKFREIVSKKQYLMEPTNKHIEWPVLSNTNRLLWFDSPFFTEVTGIKTGYTNRAGFNLVSSAVNKEGMELISVILGASSESGKNPVFDMSKELLEYGFTNYSMQNLIEENQEVRSESVVGAEKGIILPLVAKNTLSAVLPVDKEDWKLSEQVYIKLPVHAPVQAGDVFGYIEYTRQGIVLGRVEIVAAKSIEENIAVQPSTAKNSLLRNTSFRRALSVSLIILVCFALLRLVLRYISKRYKRKKYVRRYY